MRWLITRRSYCEPEMMLLVVAVTTTHRSHLVGDSRGGRPFAGAWAWREAVAGAVIIVAANGFLYPLAARMDRLHVVHMWCESV